MIVQCKVSRVFRASEKNMGVGGEQASMSARTKKKKGGEMLAMEAPEIHSN